MCIMQSDVIGGECVRIGEFAPQAVLSISGGESERIGCSKMNARCVLGMCRGNVAVRVKVRVQEKMSEALPKLVVATLNSCER